MVERSWYVAATTQTLDVLRASDPNLARFRMASRALLGAVATAAVLVGIARAVGIPASLSLVGINVAVLGSLAPADGTRRDQQISLWLVPAVAAAATVLGTLVAGHRPFGALLFLAIIFAAVAVRRTGPRGVALGMVAFIAYFFALFFHLPLAALPLALVGIGVAGAIAYAVRFAVIVERPEVILRGLRTTLVRSIALGLDALARRCVDERADGAVRRALHRVNDVALAVDDQLDQSVRWIDRALGDELRAQAFETEVGLERLAVALAGLDSPRPDVGRLLATAADALRARTTTASVEQSLAAIQTVDDRVRQRTQTSSRDLFAAIRRLEGLVIEPATSALPAPPPPPVEDHEGLHPTTRQAIQATIAAGLAMVAGTLISTTRWYWAVIAAFVVFSRTTTRGETIVRSLERALGTAGGVLVGVLLGHWFAGHSAVELAIVFVCVFVAYYFLQATYLGAVVALTLMLSALYGLLGRLTPGILYLRLAETLAGCAIGAAVATFVLPSRTHDKLASALRAVLDDLATVLEQRFAPSHPNLRELARGIDRKLRELRVASRPLAGGPFGVAVTTRTTRVVHLVATAWYFTRHLSMRADVALAEPARELLDDVAHRIAANARRAAAGEPAQDNLPAGERARERITAAGLLGSGPASARAALDWLARIDRALVDLAEIAARDEDQRSTARTSSAAENRSPSWSTR